jgi:hypothetical protein
MPKRRQVIETEGFPVGENRAECLKYRPGTFSRNLASFDSSLAAPLNITRASAFTFLP